MSPNLTATSGIPDQSRNQPLAIPNLGRDHNRLVAWALVDMFEELEGRSDIDEIDVNEAMLVAIGKMADRTGSNRENLINRSIGQIVVESELAPQGSERRRVYDHFKSRPGIGPYISAQRLALADQKRGLERAKARRAARTNGMASLTVITTEDAGYEVIDVGATDTEEHPAVVVMTTDATDDLSLFLPSSSHDTLYAIEDVVDSSRVFWEEFALQEWIDADGDTTIFAESKQDDTCDPQAGSPTAVSNLMVVACPPCIRAAATGMTTDASVALVGIIYGQSSGNVAAASAAASLTSAVGSRYGEKIVGAAAELGGKIVGWAKRLWPRS